MSAPAPCSGGRAPRHALIISYAPITDAPRVRRQAQLLLSQGWRVTLAGRAGRSAAPDGCVVVELERRFRARGYVGRAVFALLQVLSSFSGALAEWIYWRNSIVRHNYRQLAGLTGDLVICHDYITTPTALKVAQRTGAPSIMDAHEYARGQYMERPLWRYVRRPWIHSLQRRVFPRLAGITTVSEGIADLLQRENGLVEQPTVVRSTPLYQACEFRPCGEVITVLYHGILASTRGMDVLIDSVPLWREEFRLVIRGPGPAEYVEALHARVRRLGVENRVRIEGPVLFEDLVREANRADVGYFVQGDWSPQKRLALPNKFFEYTMAGLALCVSDLPEMANLLRRYDLGRLVESAEPHSVAAAINAFSREEIDACKQRSLVAARDLCWERERERLAALVDAVMARNPEVTARA